MKRTHIVPTLFFAASLSLSANAFAEELSDRIPGAQKFDVLKDFVVRHVETGDGRLTVEGTYHGKRARAVQEASRQGRTFMIESAGQPFAASDFIPGMQGFPGDMAFRIDRVVFNEKTLSMETGVRTPTARVTMSLEPKIGVAKVHAQGKAMIGSIFPDLKGVPVIDELDVDSLMFEPKAQTVSATGKINTSEVTLKIDTRNGANDPRIDFKAAYGLPLVNVLESLNGLPIVGELVLETLHAEPKARKLDGIGKVGTSEASLTIDTGTDAKESGIELKFAKGLPIRGVLKNLAATPVVRDLVFENLRADPKTRTVKVTGKIQQSDAELTLDSSRGTGNTSIDLKTVKGLPLADTLQVLKGVPVVGGFVLEELRTDPNSRKADLSGKVHGTAATMALDSAKGLDDPVLDLTVAQGLPLPEILSAAKGIPIVDNFVLESMHAEPKTRQATATGKVGTSEAALTIDTVRNLTKPGIELKIAPGLPIKNMLKDLAAVPVVRDLIFEDLRTDPQARTVKVTGKIQQSDAQLTLDSSRGTGNTAIDLKTAKGLRLAAALPVLEGVPVVGGFVLEELRTDPNSRKADLSGKVHGTAATMALDSAKGLDDPVLDLTVAQGLPLPEILSAAKGIPIVDNFVLESMHAEPKTRQATVTGKVGGIEARLTLDASKETREPDIHLKFNKGLPITRVVADLAAVPIAGDFVLEDLHAEPRAKKVSGTGKVRKTEATLTLDIGKGVKDTVIDLTITKGLPITDVMADLKDVPLVGDFVFEDLHAEPKAKKVSGTGKIRKTEATLTLDISKGVKDPIIDLTIAKGLPITDVAADLKDIPLVGDFVFEDLHAEPKAKKVSGTGKVRKTEATLILDVSKGAKNPIIDLTIAKGLPITDVAADLKDIPLVGDFVFEDLHAEPKAKKVSGTGKVRKTEATLTLDISKGVKDPIIDLTIAKGLPITDVVADLKDVPIVGDFVFEDLRAEPKAKTVSGTGKVGKTETTFTLDTSKGATHPVISLNAKPAVAVKSLIAEFGEVPVIGDFQVDGLSCDPRDKSVSAHGTLHGTGAKLTLNVAKGIQNVVATAAPDSALHLATVLPKLAGVDLTAIPVIKDIDFTGVSYEKTSKKVTVTGDVAKKRISLAVTIGSKLDAALSAKDAMTLADVVPQLENIPGVRLFGLRSLTLDGTSVTADVALGKKAATLAVDMGMVKGVSTIQSMTVTPDAKNITLATLFPELANVPTIKDLKLSDLKFVDQTKKLIADLQLGAGTAARKASLSTLPPEQGQTRVFKLTSPHLAIDDVIPSLASVPFFSKLAFDELDVRAGSIETTLTVGSETVKLFASIAPSFVAFDFGELKASAFIPGATGSALKDMALSSSVFVLSAAANVLPSDLPADMLADLNVAKDKLNTAFPKGLNLLANIKPKDLGSAFKKALSLAGITSGGGGLPAMGTLPDDIFDFIKEGAGEAKKEVVAAILEAIDLNIDVPAPQIDAISGYATFDTMHLTISGNQDSDPFWNALPANMQKRKPEGLLDVSLRGGVALKLDSVDSGAKTPINIQTLADLNIGEDAKSVSLLGHVEGEWDDPFGLPFGFKDVTFEKSGFDITLTTGDDGISPELQFFAEAELHKKTGLDVEAAFILNGLPKLDYFLLDGPLALTDLSGDLPGGSDFILHEIKVQSDGVVAKVEAKNKLFDQKTNIYVFEIDTGAKKALVGAIDLGFNADLNTKQNFSFGRLAKVAGLSDKAPKFVQTKMDAMAVANVALVLSTQSVYPLEPGALSDGIAEELFTDIFGKSQVAVRLDNVTLLSDFQADLMGDIGDALKNGVQGINLGISTDAVLNGAVGGLFDSDPLNLSLEFLMAESLSIADLQKSGLKLPSALKAKPKSAGGAGKVGLFLTVVDETFEVGLEAGFDIAYNDTTFDFTGKLGAEVAEEDIGIDLSGSMSDTWKNALGIKGFEVENVTVSGGIQADPLGLKIGLGGNTTLWDRDIGVAGDILLGLAADVPIPEGIGVKTEISDLDKTLWKYWYLFWNSALTPPPDPDKNNAGAVYDDSVKKAKLETRVSNWLLSGKNVRLSFATPGASDDALKIPDGIHFHGELALFGGKLHLGSWDPSIDWIYKVAKKIHPSSDKDSKKDSDTKTDSDGTKSDGDMQAGLNSIEAAPSLPASGSQSPSKNDQDRKDMDLLLDIVAKELGVIDKAIPIDYPKPTAKELDDLRKSLTIAQRGTFTLGGLNFSDATISMIPFKVTATAELFGNKEQVEMSLRGGTLVMESKTKIEVLGETKLFLEFDFDKKDFIVVGEYANNSALQNWLSKEIRDGIKQIADTANAKYSALNNDLSKAKKVRDAAENDLAVAQKAANAVTQAAVDRLKRTTDDYRGAYDHANHEYHHCHGWKKYYCKTKWWPRKSLAWDTWKASEQLLSDAKKALSEAKSLAVAVHKAEIKFNDAATKVALAAKDAASALDIKEIISKGLDSFANDAGKMAEVFQLDKAFLAGSLKDVAAGKPLVLELLFEIEKKKYREFFALSPTDAEFNALAFGLLPVIASEHIIDGLETKLENELGPTLGSVGNLSAKMTRWIQAHIYELIGGLHENLEKRIAGIEYELTQEESKYRKIFAALDSHATKHLDSYKDLADESNRILSTYKMTDFMPSSQTFNNRYLAVGHSLLCLGVASDGVEVFQENCKDMEAERWSAVSMGKTQEGYVQLRSKGLCLKATGANPNSGQPLILAQCNGKDDHEKWKFISQDGEFSKFVNRFAQKCLHFDTVNANEKAGYAVWTSCFGADSQGFRVIRDAEKPTFHKVEKEIKSRTVRCLAADGDFGKYFFKTSKGHATSSRKNLLNMQRQMDNALHAEACDGGDEDRFNYVEAVNGDLKLVHAKSGWCVVPGPRSDGRLVLMPCDNGKDMYWKARQSGESAFTMQNKKTGKCIHLGSRKRRGAAGTFAIETTCNGRPEQVLEFVKD